MSTIAALFPGQGSQKVGMGRELAESLPAAAKLYRQAGEILGYDLAELCFNGPAEKLDSTEISQPALFVTSLAALESLRSRESSVLLIEQDVGRALSASDRFYCLLEGRISLSGDSQTAVAVVESLALFLGCGDVAGCGMVFAQAEALVIVEFD